MAARKLFFKLPIALKTFLVLGRPQSQKLQVECLDIIKDFVYLYLTKSYRVYSV